MEKCCRNCKWYYKSQCNCPSLKANIQLQNTRDGTTYVEDGLLAESIEEELDFDAIKDIIIDKLYTDGYIKKNKNINKFSIEDIEQNLIEIIDDGLSESIMNYFDDNGDSSNINFNNIEKYYCCYWE
jgi:hypothetical protein